MSEALKPCPHCGSEPIRNEKYTDLVGCPIHAASGWYLPATWNTRPIEDKLRAEIEELKRNRWAAFSEKELQFLAKWFTYGRSKAKSPSWQNKVANEVNAALSRRAKEGK